VKPDHLLIITPLLAGICSWLCVAILVRAPSLAVDLPNERSLHATPVPRSGGMGILLPAITAGWFAAPSMHWMMFCAALLALVSFADDRYSLPPVFRLATHIAIAGMACLMSPFNWHLIWLAFAIPGIVWMTNLYNFMDGSDGLAGGMAVIGFGTYAAIAGAADHLELCIFSAALSLSALGFLFYNFHPARIFMGDVGSIPLGFLAAALGLFGWHEGVWSLAAPILIFSPFIADASMTLARRILAGERFWLPHRNHYYQRMIRMGAGHLRTAMSAYALMLTTALSAMTLPSFPPSGQAIGIAVWLMIYFLIGMSIDRRWRIHMKEQG
jgi:UDP-N-acetylmuramyl pentapeptide phosphotransferase/UDP-N-acetylglucosamine-1-phosphate transferase